MAGLACSAPSCRNGIRRLAADARSVLLRSSVGFRFWPAPSSVDPWRIDLGVLAAVALRLVRSLPVPDLSTVHDVAATPLSRSSRPVLRFCDRRPGRGCDDWRRPLGTRHLHGQHSGPRVFRAIAARRGLCVGWQRHADSGQSAFLRYRGYALAIAHPIRCWPGEAMLAGRGPRS